MIVFRRRPLYDRYPARPEFPGYSFAKSIDPEGFPAHITLRFTASRPQNVSDRTTASRYARSSTSSGVWKYFVSQITKEKKKRGGSLVVAGSSGKWILLFPEPLGCRGHSVGIIISLWNMDTLSGDNRKPMGL